MSTRTDFAMMAAGVVSELRALREHIDALGDLGAEVAGSDRVDMLACFASNSLYGAEALIEQIKTVVAHPKSKRARWPF